ncbi:MAG: tetratricopeptide repeat protein [Alphaproteobacteria bacterium]
MRRLKHASLAALVAAAFGFAPIDGARADIASDAELKRTFDELQRRPGDINLNYKYAQQLVKSGDYEGAIAVLEGLLLINPEQPRLRLEIGVLYMRLNSFPAAKTYLRRALQSPNLPPEVRVRIEAYLAEIEKRGARSYVDGTISLGARYQTNPNLAPEGSTVVLRGIGTPNGVKSRPDVSMVLHARATHVFDFKTNDETKLVSNFVGYFARQAAVNEANIMLAEFNTGPRFRLVQGTNPGLYVRPFVMGLVIGLDDRYYSSSIGGGLDISVPYGDRWAFEATYQGRYASYENIRGRDTSTRLTGIEHLGRMRVGYKLDTDLAVLGEVTGRYTDARASYQDFYEVGVNATLTWDYESPYSWAARRWNVTGTVGYYHRDYMAADPNVHPTTKRREEELRLGLAHVMRVDDNWMFIQQVDYMLIDGNLSNYDRNDFAATVGVRYRF